MPIPKQWQLAVGIFLGALALILAVFLINGQVTAWIEGPRFQDLLERETSKGLKLQATYAPLHRVGLFGLRTDSFTGTNGYKTIVSLEAQDISGTFNPLGAILRRWEIDSIHIQSGTVWLQKTEAAPGASKGTPWPPWWALFWPYRVHLADIKVDDAHVLFKLQDKESGIYDTRLEVTPNGRDFEYDAHGGAFSTPLTPPLQVEHIHLLVRKPRLYCSAFVLGDDPAHPEEQLRIESDAGLQDDRTMKLEICQADVKWDAGAISAENIQVECAGVFRLTGTIKIAADKTLSGQAELGLTEAYLRWLPTARSAIFTRDEGGYHFTTIHFSGTAQKPVQDLSPRVAKEVEKSPMLALKLFFNQAGEWFDSN